MNMKLTLGAAMVATGFLTLPAQVVAHHSFAAEFDADSPIALTGIVTSVKWSNPHTFFYIDVETEINGDWMKPGP